MDLLGALLGGDRLRRTLLAVVLGYSLLYMGVWATGRWEYRRGQTFITAIAPGYRLLVEVWPLAVLSERFSPYSYHFSFFDPQARNARWVSIWYENAAAKTRTRLVSFVVPTWPLRLATAGLWGMWGLSVALQRASRARGQAGVQQAGLAAKEN